MVMTIAKITGNGWEYLTRHTSRGDGSPSDASPSGTAPEATGDGKNPKDPAAYYTAAGIPPGRWTGRAAHLLGLDGRQVTEEAMRNLFGLGAHPDAGAMITAYIARHVTASMTAAQREQVKNEAIRSATLGRRFPAYRPLEPFDHRVGKRLQAIEQEAKRTPTDAEARAVQSQEARRQRAAVAGFDLTFSPVKSASLLWATDDRPRVRDAVQAAHQRAVHEAMNLVEDHAAYTRTGAGGIAQVTTKGLVAAAFEHWDSRAGDPDLHTHVAVSAKVQGADGAWRSLDARGLYRIAVAASECYNTAFEAHLTSLLGVTFTPRPGTTSGREPVREITGIPPGMIAYFSRRRAAIEARYAHLLTEYRTAHGHDPGLAACHKLAQQATLDTRQGKQPPTALPGKRARWREELTAEFGPAATGRIKQAVPAAPVSRAPLPSPDPSHLAERIVASVSSRRSTWSAWNVRAEAERVVRTECPPLPPAEHRHYVDTLTALALSPGNSISVEPPALLNEPPELRRENGEPVFTEHAAARFTSQPVLDAEQRLLDATRTPTTGALARPAVTAAIDGFEAVSGQVLDPGQRALVTAFCADGRLLLAGIGPAGAGKTTATRACAHVLRQAGRRLIPLATSAAAAGILGRELSLPAENLHKFLHEHTAGPFASRLRAAGPVPASARPFLIRPGDVILLDEAGMAGTFPIDQLTSIAAARGATVRLLGDDRQLPAVESGGALRLIASQPGTPELTALHRFRNPEEAAATLAIRAGDGAALDFYQASGRIRGGSREAMTEAAYQGWKADMLAGKTTLMAAGGGAAVAGLAARA
ncbi:MAG: relaxase domain-containing protein, partial [Nocardiopsaceae bacterium]|nr:relaxase domain-containing protein [Nocardiopsaceae bacterium]